MRIVRPGVGRADVEIDVKRRSALWVPFVVALVAGYVGRNFTGIGPVPTRSAFAGRLPSTPDGDWRRFQFYYATNRAADDEATFQGQGNKLGGVISAGTFDVRISPELRTSRSMWVAKRVRKIDSWTAELPPPTTTKRLSR